MGKQILIVEGKNDGYALTALLKALDTKLPRGYDSKEKIKEFIGVAEGFEQVQNSLQEPLDQPDYTNIGVVVDADESFQGRLDWFANAIKGYASRDTEYSGPGTLARGTNRTLGLWVMPSHQDSGCLENFLAALIPHEDKLWPRAETTITNLQTEQLTTFNFNAASKARLYTWLAWQKKPGLPFGSAIEGKTLPNINTPNALAFKEWFKKVFELNP